MPTIVCENVSNGAGNAANAEPGRARRYLPTRVEPVVAHQVVGAVVVLVADRGPIGEHRALGELDRREADAHRGRIVSSDCDGAGNDVRDPVTALENSGDDIGTPIAVVVAERLHGRVPEHDDGAVVPDDLRRATDLTDQIALRVASRE